MKSGLKILFLFILVVSCNLSNRKELPNTDEYKKLIGKWNVVESNFLPFDHISFCKGLDLGTIFYFDKFGVLKVYESIVEKDYCNDKQSYWIKDDDLVIFEWDIAWSYEILILTSDTLKVKIDKIPFYLEEELFVGDGNDFNDDPRVKFIREVGIIVTMKKIENGG